VSARLRWLHSAASADVDGYEWGIVRIKWQQGQAVEVWHTAADFSDLDAAMRATGHDPNAGGRDDVLALVYLYGAHMAEHPEDSSGAQQRLAAIRASLASPCSHRIADARNAAIQSGYMCVDCHHMFAAADQGPGLDTASMVGVGTDRIEPAMPTHGAPNLYVEPRATPTVDAASAMVDRLRERNVVAANTNTFAALPTRAVCSRRSLPLPASSATSSRRRCCAAVGRRSVSA
jgi:hypothetical protein